MNIVSWQPVLTDHLSWTLEALQRAAQCHMDVHVLHRVHAERQTQGWLNRHVDRLSPEPLPEKGGFLFAFRKLRNSRDAVHIFGSPFESAKLMAILLAAVAMGRRVYMISEPYSPISAGYQNDRRGFLDRLKPLLRPAAYSCYGWLISRRIAGVFAISCLAVRQYQRMGVPKENMFPFGYFVPREDGLPTASSREPVGKRSLRAVFVGNLIARKGLDILMTAVHELENQGLPITLDVFGPGDPTLYAFNGTTIRHRGIIPFGKAQTVISEYDVLVLPSRFDGWGVVVNEALLAGVPVVCSDMAGAGDLLGKWSCGTTFIGGDVADLARKLKALLVSPELLSDWRRGTVRAAEVIQPGVAGRYMFDIINRKTPTVKPAAPWYDCP